MGKFFDIFIVIVFILCVVMFGTYQVGYLNDAYNAVISSFPIVGEMMSIIDTYNFFRFMVSEDIRTFEDGYIVVCYVISLMASYYTWKYTNNFEGLTKFLSSMFVGFVSTCILKFVFIEGYIKPIENLLEHVKMLMNNHF